MNQASLRSSFPAMTTTVDVVSVGIAERQHHHAMEEVIEETDAWIQRFSRFIPESMLSTVNLAEGQWVDVDAVFVDLLETARDAVIATAGRFNPAVLPALLAHGYDRTIEDVRNSHHVTRPYHATPAPLGAWQDIDIDRRRSRIRLPDGVQVDLGGIAKGALADRLADRFAQWPGGAISIGGDMRVWGSPPSGEAWRVGIEHPLDHARDVAVLELQAGHDAAIATSSRTKRAWGTAHHLIDPSTGSPASTNLLAVSACAPSATMAEIVTKNVMIASSHGPITSELLLGAHWALTVSNALEITRITREVA